MRLMTYSDILGILSRDYIGMVLRTSTMWKFQYLGSLIFGSPICDMLVVVSSCWDKAMGRDT